MSKHYLHEAESTKCYVKGKCFFFFSEQIILLIRNNPFWIWDFHKASLRRATVFPLISSNHLTYSFLINTFLRSIAILFCQSRLVFLLPWGFTGNIMNHTHVAYFALTRTLYKTRKPNLQWSSVSLYPESKKYNQNVKNITFMVIKATKRFWLSCARNML